MLAEECISNLRDCLTLLLRYSERSDIRFYVRYSTIWSVYDLIITESDPCILLLVTVINTRTKSGNHGWISRDSALTKAIHPSIVCIRFIPFYGVAGFFFFLRVLNGQVASSSQGPHWWQRPPCKVPTIWGLVSCSRTLQHAAQLSQGLGFEPATFRSLANLLNVGCQQP